MTHEEPGVFPYAPAALKSAIEASEDLTTSEMHIATVEHVREVLGPILDALSVPEQIPYSNLPQDQGLRRVLSYPPQVTFNADPYRLHVREVIRPDKATSSLIIEATTNSPDEIRIAYLGPGVKAFNGDEFPWDMVKDGRNAIAGGRALQEIREIADFIAREAPRQALEAGKISLHWMERYKHKGFFRDSVTLSEGFPNESEPGLYEIISLNGSRSICTVIDRDGQKAWREDVHGLAVWTEHSVIAWREMRQPYPQYYSEAKYPRFYPKSANS